MLRRALVAGAPEASRCGCQSAQAANEFPKVDGLFDVVNREDRYDLVRLIILHSHAWKADINDDSDLQTLRIKQWPLRLFQSIPSEKAHELLLRLIRVKRDGDFLQLVHYGTRPFNAPTILAQPPSPERSYGDPILLSILLGSEGRMATQDAQKLVESQRERSFKGRDQATRAFYAKSAAFYAIASGSLDLYDQIMTWSRRYVRDPLSLKTIYDSDAITTKEGIALLSGIPADLSHLEAGKICELVTKGNEILVSILQTAILALNEPSFSSMDWDGPKLVFRDVVEHRIMQSGRLKIALSLTEDTIYDILWGPTLEMLLKVERLGLQKGHEMLRFNCPNGPFYSSRREPKLGRFRFGAASYRFFDDLARARNDLWVQYRPTLHPECASLPEEWPRGLPIQALLGDLMYGIQHHAAKPYTPYITSRSVAVVYLKHNPAVNEDKIDEDMRAAVAGCVDRYETALSIQVLQQKPGRRQEEEVSTIVAHVI